MTTGKKLLVGLALGLALTLSGCGSREKVEMPGNTGEGSDEMRKSPCACVELDYNGRGFEWLG